MSKISKFTTIDGTTNTINTYATAYTVPSGKTAIVDSEIYGTSVTVITIKRTKSDATYVEYEYIYGTAKNHQGIGSCVLEAGDSISIKSSVIGASLWLNIAED